MSNKYNKSNKDYTKYAKAAEEVVESVVEETPVIEEPVINIPVAGPAIEIPDVKPVSKTSEALEPGDNLPLPKAGRVFNCARLNVRVAPKSGATIVCEIPCNTEVEINEAESTDDFYKIYTASGVEGFCMKSYILEK